MGYTALYRKFRPGGFEEVKGQDAIVTTLKNQIQADRIGHAYLFCGTRGTGKTSVAKILARAVNCEHPTEGSPCGECPMCRRIAEGTSMNVIEIDAASNNGVDNIREIIDEVQYSPTEGRYKVYIIDEVHMLSPGAFNALLKTLEEPPSYVIFILATTEAHKIPITILSRCQRYDFKRISIETITARLQELMEREGNEAEEKALRYVAKAGDGSMRDSLSLLDQCLAFHFGKKLTYDNVLEVLGAVDTEVFTRLFYFLLSGQVEGCLDLLEKIVMDGRDITQFAVDMTWYFRNLLLLSTSEEAADRIDVASDQLEQMKEAARRTDGETLMRYIRIFSELSGQLRYASQKRVIVEIALIKLCKPEMETDYTSLVERVKQLEERLEQYQSQGLSAFLEKGGSESLKALQAAGGSLRQDEVETKGEPVYEKAVPEDLQEVAKNWTKIVAGLSHPLKTYIKEAKPSAEGGSLLLVFEDPLDKGCVDTEAHLSELKQAINQCVKKDVEIRTVCRKAAAGREADWIDLSRMIKAQIEYVD